MYLYLVRHAQSENNKLYFDNGFNDDGRKADPLLSSLGNVQAKRLSAYIKSASTNSPASKYDWNNFLRIKPTHLYTNLMTRAVQTGHYVAEVLELPLVGLDYTHECGGLWLDERGDGEKRGQPGRSKKQFEEIAPRLVTDNPYEKGWWGRPYETELEWANRARRFAEFACTQHSMEDSVMLFSHAQFIGVIIGTILGVSDQENIRFHIQNTGITRLRWNGSHWALQYQNRLSHLTARMIS